MRTKTKRRARSAVTGRYVSLGYAAAHSQKTVLERTKRLGSKYGPKYRGGDEFLR